MVDLSSLSFGNAAGFLKGVDRSFNELLSSAATHITVGSITVEMRPGNPGNTYHPEEDGTSLNALGLPNPGLEAILHIAAYMASKAEEHQKRLRWSLAGSSPAEYGQLARALVPYGDLECNLGCPNVWGAGGQKPIAAFNLEVIEAIIAAVEANIPATGMFDLKLSPYSDPSFIPKVCGLLKKPDRSVRDVVLCNTFPNGMQFSNGKPVLQSPGGYGGVGGRAMHLIALGQVAQFAQELESTGMGIIGVGGVDSGSRLLAMLHAGATGVQIGTHFGTRGARVFSEILEEAVALE